MVDLSSWETRRSRELLIFILCVRWYQAHESIFQSDLDMCVRVWAFRAFCRFVVAAAAFLCWQWNERNEIKKNQRQQQRETQLWKHKQADNKSHCSIENGCAMCVLIPPTSVTFIANCVGLCARTPHIKCFA